ncbi:hypothetical protein WA577_001474 [Blastocystis sp. JDR]
MSEAAVLGIDFGSLYWKSFVSRGSQNSIVCDEHGNRCLDASVFFNDGEIVIGSSAAVLTKSFPNNVINHPMHYLDNHKCCSDCNSGVTTEMDGDYPVFCIPFTSGIERISLERVFTECFKRLYNLAVLTFNCDPVATVISLPSDLSPKSQEYVLNCAKAAGLPSVTLIPHHLACITALESSHEESKDASSSSEGTIVVVDLPANTASVSLVSSSNGFYKTVASQRLQVRVGEEITSCLFDYVMKEACRKLGSEVAHSKKAAKKLQHEVVLCKERLSSTMSSAIMIDSLFDGVDFTMNVTRARLEMYAHAVAVKLQEQVKAVLAAHRVELTSIEKMVVVGGSALVPFVQEALKPLSNGRLWISPRPREVIAEGAALHGSMREKSHLRKVLPKLQQVAFSILLAVEGWKSVVVEKGVVLPFKKMTEGRVEGEKPVSDVIVLYEVNGEEKKCGELHFNTDLCGKRLLMNCNGDQFSGIHITLFVFDGNKEVEKKEFCLRDE